MNPSVSESSTQKSTFKIILGAMTIVLMILPFVTTFNEFLTRIVESLKIYRFIDIYIVPYQIRLIEAVLHTLRIQTVSGSTSVFSVIKDGLPVSVRISWNCIGWQSLILLIITFATGLQGNYTLKSKLECLTVGLLGTFLMNIFRMTLVVLMLYFFGSAPAIIFHDYGSTLMIISWLFFFWWLSYTTILVQKS